MTPVTTSPWASGARRLLVAAVGTLLVAGDWWFEAFAVPMIAAHAPDVLKLPPGGPLLAGAVITSSLFAAGWILFGVAALRSGAFSRTAAVLVVMGGACGFLALSTPYSSRWPLLSAGSDTRCSEGPGSRRPLFRQRDRHPNASVRALISTALTTAPSRVRPTVIPRVPGTPAGNR